MTLNQYYHITEKRPAGVINKKGVWLRLYTFEFLFETKEEYLAFVLEWKAQYKELSARLKTAKMDVRNHMRDGTLNWSEQGHVVGLKGQAQMMLEMRRQGKLAAAKQAQKQREAAVA